MGLAGSVLLATACGQANTPGIEGTAGSGAGETSQDPQGSAGSGGTGSTLDCQCTAFEQRADWSDRSCVCTPETCPEVEDALEPLDSCSGTPRIDDYGPVLRRGCGRIEYYRWAHGVSRFQFDALDGTSLAVQLGTDTAGLICDGQRVTVYSWGDMMDLRTCADYSECTNCKTLTSESPSIPACAD